MKQGAKNAKNNYNFANERKLQELYAGKDKTVQGATMNATGHTQIQFENTNYDK